jgi:hypothetical protein
MLIGIMSVYNSPSMVEARVFWSNFPAGLGFDETLMKYPRGSEELQRFGSMMAFWDTVGILLKRGLLSQDLVFDSFLDDPPWLKVERFYEEARKNGSPHEGENLEIAYNLSVKWKAAREKRERDR